MAPMLAKWKTDAFNDKVSKTEELQKQAKRKLSRMKHGKTDDDKYRTECLRDTERGVRKCVHLVGFTQGKDLGREKY